MLFKITATFLIKISLIIGGCGAEDKGKVEGEDNAETDDPDGVEKAEDTEVSYTNLLKIIAAAAPMDLRDGKTGSALSLRRGLSLDCEGDQHTNLGIFWGLWRYSCAISQSASEVLFGKARSSLGELTKEIQADESSYDTPKSSAELNDASTMLAQDDPCKKIVKEDKTSFFSIVCSLKDEDVTDAAFEIEGQDPALAVGISFAKFGDYSSVGYYNSQKLQFPLMARVWESTSISDLKSSYAVRFEDENSGEIHLMFDSSAAVVPQVKLAFKRAPDGVDCAISLEPADCHEHKFEFYGGEESRGTQKSMYFRILANDKSAPTLTVIEGTWALTAAQAKPLMSTDGGVSGNSLFEKGRTVYFRIINKDAIVWAQYIIRDDEGAVIAGEGMGKGKGPILAEVAGHCMDFEIEPSPDLLFSFQDCGSTDFTDIASKMTLGETETEFVQAGLPISSMDFSDRPAAGVRTK